MKSKITFTDWNHHLDGTFVGGCSFTRAVTKGDVSSKVILSGDPKLQRISIRVRKSFLLIFPVGRRAEETEADSAARER